MEENEPEIIRYEEILVPEDKKEPGTSEEEVTSSSESDAESSPTPPTRPDTPTADPERAARIKQENIDAILDCIVHPRRFERDGKLYIRRLSRELSTRTELVELSQRFEDYLKQRQVRMKGYCPVRRELYDLLFDELIRQATISCPERGSLLLRVRDEFRLTLAAYEKLFENGIEYGIRKSVEAEMKVQGLQIQHSQLAAEKARAEKRIRDLEAVMEAEETRSRQHIDMMQEQHEKKMEFLRKTNRQLKEQIDVIDHVEQ